MGRPKGSPNKPKQTLLQRLRRDYPGYHPVVEMAAAAHKLKDMADDAEAAGLAHADMRRDSAKLHGDVAKFVTPQLKAVDLTSDGDQIAFNFTLKKKDAK